MISEDISDCDVKVRYSQDVIESVVFRMIGVKRKYDHRNVNQLTSDDYLQCKVSGFGMKFLEMH